MSYEFPPAKQFWDQACEELGFTARRGYDDNTLLWHPLYRYGRKGIVTMEDECSLWEDGYVPAPMEIVHDVKCERLSTEIAIETGQAKRISHNVVRFRTTERFAASRQAFLAEEAEWSKEMQSKLMNHDERT